MAEATATLHGVKTFESSGGAQVYQMPVEAFPALWTNTYLIFVENYVVLIDCGSNFHSANQHLDDGFAAVSKLRGQPLSYADLTHILITHGHIDHFGGLAYLEDKTQARIGVHELDLRTLTNFEERLVVVAGHLREFLVEAGVSAARVQGLLDMYMLPKSLISSVRVDFTYEATGMRMGPFEFLHVPGHGAGQVSIRLHDLLFSGDHVLAGVSPHMAPERLSLNTGLAHYLDSLQALDAWAGDARLTLAGHNGPIEDLSERIAEIRDLHAQRLRRVLDLLAESHTVAEVSKALFNTREGYDVLLALEESGAHIEYLYERGLLAISNLEALRDSDQPIPIRYQRLGPVPDSVL